MNFNRDFLSYLFGNKKGSPYELPQSLDWGSLNFEEKLLYKTLTHSIDEFVSTLDLSALTPSEIYHLIGHRDFLNEHWQSILLTRFKDEYLHLETALKAPALNEKELQELLDFKNETLSVFAIFKKNRKAPGKLFIRLPSGEFLKNKNQSVWQLPVLGQSSRGLDFNHTNGQTPTGVYQLNSVMPEANNPKEFGIYRRLKIYYQEDQSLLIPKSHETLAYWQQALISKILGRSLFRIHGTGMKNNKIFDPAFPMVASSGCLTVRERDFLGQKLFNHQRLLLDKLMDSLDLPTLYENETKIQAYLYVVDFGGKFQNIQFK